MNQIEKLENIKNNLLEFKENFNSMFWEPNSISNKSQKFENWCDDIKRTVVNYIEDYRNSTFDRLYNLIDILEEIDDCFKVENSNERTEYISKIEGINISGINVLNDSNGVYNYNDNTTKYFFNEDKRILRIECKNETMDIVLPENIDISIFKNFISSNTYIKEILLNLEKISYYENWCTLESRYKSFCEQYKKEVIEQFPNLQDELDEYEDEMNKEISFDDFGEINAAEKKFFEENFLKNGVSVAKAVDFYPKFVEYLSNYSTNTLVLNAKEQCKDMIQQYTNFFTDTFTSLINQKLLENKALLEQERNDSISNIISSIDDDKYIVVYEFLEKFYPNFKEEFKNVILSNNDEAFRNIMYEINNYQKYITMLNENPQLMQIALAVNLIEFDLQQQDNNKPKKI